MRTVLVKVLIVPVQTSNWFLFNITEAMTRSVPVCCTSPDIRSFIFQEVWLVFPLGNINNCNSLLLQSRKTKIYITCLYLLLLLVRKELWAKNITIYDDLNKKRIVLKLKWCINKYLTIENKSHLKLKD